MAAFASDDVLEKILIGLEVKDLIRFKSVCKSWQSFISSSRFIKSHLNYTYNCDRNNNKIGHKRILMSWIGNCGHIFGYHSNDDFTLGFHNCYLIGSSNGLVCIRPMDNKVYVANPLTREVRKLPVTYQSSLCFGFGYDSSIDDYKIIVGFKPDIVVQRTYFKVFTLKSNVWKLIKGNFEYTYNKIHGVLCNGALHWFMCNRKNKKVILSFNLSREEFTEIPQPEDPRYETTIDARLGIIEESLCIFRDSRPLLDKWVMKKYNEKQSWELMKYDLKRDHSFAHFLKIRGDYTLHKDSFFDNHEELPRTWEYISAPIFVESLVSPHICRITD